MPKPLGRDTSSGSVPPNQQSQVDKFPSLYPLDDSCRDWGNLFTALNTLGRSYHAHLVTDDSR